MRQHRGIALLAGGIALSFSAGIVIDRALPERASTMPTFESRAATASGPVIETKPCAGPQDHDRSELCAQWRSTLAAEQSASWSASSFWLALFGSVVGFMTLLAAVIAALYTGQAARYAGEAAEHAKTGADEAKRSADIAANATRAWVVCDEIVLDGPIVFRHIEGLGDRYEMNGKVVIRNTGSALAKSVMTMVDIMENGGNMEEFWDQHPEKSMARYEAHKMPWPLGVTLAPNTPVGLSFGWGGPAPFAPPIEKARAGTFYFIGYIRYRDHHDRDAYTRFAFQPDGDSVKSWDGKSIVPAGAFGEAT
ncbi:hypothetical protein [Sphingomonas abietis]|uniref:Uncharacterized protein n=1 Tax=Sphingomonas abietis TaxID=3012344 RepID=A0ABY7NQM9_9SPHN|nr:hypothetical protein [Sphingomonas abietis]WBO23844.1 hypothetical protein PBT88_06905 [Sphingomonas abietis]